MGDKREVTHSWIKSLAQGTSPLVSSTHVSENPQLSTSQTKLTNVVYSVVSTCFDNVGAVFPERPDSVDDNFAIFHDLFNLSVLERVDDHTLHVLQLQIGDKIGQLLL